MVRLQFVSAIVLGVALGAAFLPWMSLRNARIRPPKAAFWTADQNGWQIVTGDASFNWVIASGLEEAEERQLQEGAKEDCKDSLKPSIALGVSFALVATALACTFMGASFFWRSLLCLGALSCFFVGLLLHATELLSAYSRKPSAGRYDLEIGLGVWIFLGAVAAAMVGNCWGGQPGRMHPVPTAPSPP